MKKYIVFVIAFLILHSNIVFADFNEKLQRHWAKDVVEKEFLEKYFQDLSKDDYSLFMPDSSITVKSFESALNNLIETYKSININMDMKLSEIHSGEGIRENEVLLRKDAIKMIHNAIDVQTIDETIEIPFTDVKGLEKHYIEGITKLYNLEIINGYSDGRLGPEESIKQIEAVILLHRLKLILINRIKNIPFKVINSETKYNGKEGVIIEENNNSVNITITKMLPNPGYNINIEKIEQIESGNYKIYVNTANPDSKKIYPQVISYKSLILEVEKDYLQNEYKFESDFPKGSEMKTK